MKGMRTILTVAIAGVAMMAGMAAHAQNTIVFGGVGSSAMFTVSAQTAQAQGCNKMYANSSGMTTNAGDSGQFWIGVNTTVSPHKVYYYLQVDSTVGVRCYFTSATVNTSTFPASGTGNVTISGITNVDASDADIQSAKTFINGAVFNVGLTDITPADAKVATAKSLAQGYNNTGATKIHGMNSSGGDASVGVLDFNLSARAFSLTTIGAAPIMVVVNKSLTTTGHFGNTAVTNINRFVLGLFLDGSLTRTRDAIPASALGDFPVVTFVRELLSGTYNTTEHCIPASLEVNTSQDPIAEPNPLNTTTPAFVYLGAAPTAGGRVRAIGTGASLTLANGTTNVDTLTYAFWSFGNFAGKTNLKYLQVDSVEPLQDAYVDGTLPTTTAAVTFKHILDGTYPIWSFLRAVVISSPSSDLTTYLGAITTSANGSNFVPKNQMQVFRSHRATAAAPSPANGNNGTAEAGADAGGAVFTINADVDFFNDNFSELINQKQ